MSTNTYTSYKNILMMTMPVMFGMFAEFIVNIINSAFLSRVDGDSFSAAGNAGLLYVSVMMIAYGIAGATQIIVARRDGENDHLDMGKIMLNNFALIAFINTTLFIFFQLFGGSFFNATVANPEIAEKMEGFLSIRSLGVFFSILEYGFFAYYTGTGKTLPVMFATISQGLTNFFFDYALIFGNFGFPEMGLEGAAWSTVISDGFSGLTYLLFFVFTEKNKTIRKFYKNKVQSKKIREIFKLGIPLIGQGFVSVGAWTFFFFMIEHLGKDELEISQTIRSFYYVCLAVVLSFGTTAKTMVSKMIAEGRQKEIKRMMMRIITCSLIATVLVTHANFLYPHLAVPVINGNPRLLDATILTLQLVSLAMIMFAVSIALTSMVSGAGDTRASFYIETFSIVVYLFVAYLITNVYPQPIHLVWCVEYVYFSLMIIAAYLYLRTDKWKNIQV